MLPVEKGSFNLSSSENSATLHSEKQPDTVGNRSRQSSHTRQLSVGFVQVPFHALHDRKTRIESKKEEKGRSFRELEVLLDNEVLSLTQLRTRDKIGSVLCKVNLSQGTSNRSEVTTDPFRLPRQKPRHNTKQKEKKKHEIASKLLVHNDAKIITGYRIRSLSLKTEKEQISYQTKEEENAYLRVKRTSLLYSEQAKGFIVPKGIPLTRNRREAMLKSISRSLPQEKFDSIRKRCQYVTQSSDRDLKEAQNHPVFDIPQPSSPKPELPNLTLLFKRLQGEHESENPSDSVLQNLNSLISPKEPPSPSSISTSTNASRTENELSTDSLSRLSLDSLGSSSPTHASPASGRSRSASDSSKHSISPRRTFKLLTSKFIPSTPKTLPKNETSPKASHKLNSSFVVHSILKSSPKERECMADSASHQSPTESFKLPEQLENSRLQLEKEKEKKIHCQEVLCFKNFIQQSLQIQSETLKIIERMMDELLTKNKIEGFTCFFEAIHLCLKELEGEIHQQLEVINQEGKEIVLKPELETTKKSAEPALIELVEDRKEEGLLQLKLMKNRYLDLAKICIEQLDQKQILQLIDPLRKLADLEDIVEKAIGSSISTELINTALLYPKHIEDIAFSHLWFVKTEDILTTIISSLSHYRIETEARDKATAANNGTQITYLLNLAFNILNFNLNGKISPENLHDLRGIAQKICSERSVEIVSIAKQVVNKVDEILILDLSDRLNLSPKNARSDVTPLTFKDIETLVEEGNLKRSDIKQLAWDLRKKLAQFFINISPEELSCKRWLKSDKSTPNMDVSTIYFNAFVYWTGWQIVSGTTEQKRAKWCEFFIRLAKSSLHIGNYCLAMAICAGLNQAGVARLKLTWAKVKSKYLKIRDRLNVLFDQAKNSKCFREELKKWEKGSGISTLPPAVLANGCIPFLGLYLNDLFFIDEANPNFLSNEQINLDKIVMLADIHRKIFNMQQCLRKQDQQDIKYNIDDAINSILRIQDAESTIYKISLEREARKSRISLPNE